MAEQLRRERLRREMIDEIIAAARALLEKDGPGAISIRAIARQVGVSAPAIYRYFPSLDALIHALNDSVINELCAAVEPPAGPSAAAAPSAVADSSGAALAFRAWALDHPASLMFTLGLTGHLANGQTLMGRLSRLPGPASSPLPWATLCGLVLLELAADPADLPEIRRLYETVFHSPVHDFGPGVKD
jgi:AcrR family transcriptional regulator